MSVDPSHVLSLHAATSLKLAATPGNEATQMATWDDDHLTVHQKAWMMSEAAELSRIFAGLGTDILVADVGSGDSRFLKKLTSTIGRYVGFEIETPTVEQARQEFPDTSRFNFPDAGDYKERIPEYLDAQGGGRFDALICIGNTLGTLQGDRIEHVANMFAHTDHLVISVMRNEVPVMLRRLEYYGQNGYDCSVDWKTGIINSKEWGDSYSWTEAQLAEIGEAMKAHGATSYEITKAEPLGFVLHIGR